MLNVSSSGGSALPSWAFIPFLFVGGLIAATGLWIAARAVISMRRSMMLTRAGVAVEGTIVDNQMESRKSSMDVGTADMPVTSTSAYFLFRPVVKFRTPTGQEMVAVAPKVSRSSYLAGTSVSLLYLPERPDQVKIVRGPGSGGSAAPGLVIGLVTAGLATAFLLVAHAMIFASPVSDGSACPPGLNLPAGATCTSP